MDRLSQLQDLVLTLEGLFCVSIEELRKVAPSGSAQAEADSSGAGPAVKFAKLIAQRAAAIDRFIGYLPSADATESIQREHLQALNHRNAEERQRLEEAIDKAETMLARVRAVLKQITDSHYRLVHSSQPAHSAPAARQTVGHATETSVANVVAGQMTAKQNDAAAPATKATVEVDKTQNRKAKRENVKQGRAKRSRT